MDDIMVEDPNKGHLLVNKTKGSTVGYADMANSFFSRLMGLMFKGNLERGLILKKTPSAFG